MTLWFLFAVMTAAAIFAVLWPLGRGAAPRRSGSDLEVYRDQIAELARDRDAGMIARAEAEAARVEVSRRLLAAAEQSQSGIVPSPGGTFRRRAAAVVVLAGVPAVALGLYLALGSPDLPGQPIASRAAAPVQNRGLDALLAQVEAHLDGQGDRAVSIWRDMLSQAPPDSPWAGMVRETLARVEGGAPPAGQPAASPAAPGPTADDVAAADKMAPEDRFAMVRSMVER